MGAWGSGAFDNDTAADWAWGIEDCDDLDYVRSTLSAALDPDEEDLEVDLACESLAACEVIARLKGNWGARNAFSETVDNWVDSHKLTPDAALVEMAVKVIERVLTPPSELLELWTEANASEWKTAVEDLRRRVTA